MAIPVGALRPGRGGGVPTLFRFEVMDENRKETFGKGTFSDENLGRESLKTRKISEKKKVSEKETKI